jgi:predicted  nucleic acid-binding Zn-ribbon protein
VTEDIGELPSSADFGARFFEGAEIVKLEISVLKETYDDILATIERNKWDTEEGLRILLTLGLGYAQGQYLLQCDDAQRARLAERLADLESVAAAMKFRAFTFMRDNQVLEMRSAALQKSVVGLEAVIKRIHPERDELKTEVDRLRSEVTALKNDLAAVSAIAPTPAAASPAGSSWGHRLKPMIKVLRRLSRVNNHQSGTRT